MTLKFNSPSEEELEDLLLSCRYGDLADVHDFVGRFGPTAFDDHVDEFGNSCLHMAAANGHQDVVEYILNNIQKNSTLDRTNLPPASNTPLHWAALNHHLAILKLLCARMTTEQISKLNGRGMSAMSEAMGSMNSKSDENNPTSTTQTSSLDSATTYSDASTQIPIREQCVNYLVEMMKLGENEKQDSDSVDPKESDSAQDQSINKLNQKIEITRLNDIDPIQSQVQALR